MTPSKMPVANGKISVAPSILSADLWQLGNEVQKVQAAGADWLHVDIMDGHFVPNLSFGPSVVSSLSKNTALPLDVHLMMEEPLLFVEPFAKAGADLLTVQVRNELYATTNQVGYLFNYFGDGAPVLGEAFARVKLG